jgi:hypothetical protein
VNTHSEYRRHGYQSPQPPTPQPETAASELARRRDPSLAAERSKPAIAQNHVAWVRPTELASYAGPMVGRGIDLHAELLRRARRAPITATRELRHPTPAIPPTPISTTNRTEGLQL